jgi:hypothetical protein
MFPSHLHPSSTQGKIVFYCFSHMFTGCILFRLGEFLPSNVRNRLDMKRDALRLALTTLQPDIQNLQVLIRPKEHTEYNASY